MRSPPSLPAPFSDWARARAWPLASAWSAAALFWLRDTTYLYERHPHEDAFILFRYVEHLASGHGIVFNSAGPTAEGATDFLYLMMLSLLVRLGADVAIAAVWLNGVGSGLIAFVFTSLATGSSRSALSGVFALLIGGCVPFLAGAHASYDGFGTQLYCALARRPAKGRLEVSLAEA